jgi:hypothetical protein
VKTDAKKPRTVKISDTTHHRIRVLAVQKRVSMQVFIENLLVAGLRDKVYERFGPDEKPAATAAVTVKTPALA